MFGEQNFLGGGREEVLSELPDTVSNESFILSWFGSHPDALTTLGNHMRRIVLKGLSEYKRM